jgi:hypothetical protein
MNPKLLIAVSLIGLLLLVSVAVFFVHDPTPPEEKKSQENLYQGPVPEGYDLEHFRLTGETRKLGE